MFARSLLPLLFAALAAAPASAQQVPAPRDEALEFETVHSYALDLDEIGSGWGLVSIYPGSYEVGLEAAPDLEGRQAAYIKAGPGGNYAQGDLMQSVDMIGLGGRRIRSTARIRNQGDGFAVFWMNAFSGDGRVLRTTNTRLALNTGWQPQELVLDLPAETGRLEIGVSLQGREGAGIWLDRVTLEASGDRP